MPTYEYRCEGCGHELEVFQNISESPKRKCPACKKNRLKRKIGGGAGFLFKGSGFYLTDYRSDSYKKAADADGKPAESKSADAKAEDKGPGASAPGTAKPAESKSGPSTPKPKKGK